MVALTMVVLSPPMGWTSACSRLMIAPSALGYLPKPMDRSYSFTRTLPVFLGIAWMLLSGVPAVNGAPNTNTPTQIQERLKQAPAHPRLFWLASDEARVRKNLTGEPRLQDAWDAVRITADHMLKEPPVVYRKDGRRLLGRSREALGRVMHLGFAYRMTHDRRYAERAIKEMEAMAEMPDWNPSHFLDTAEMTLAMAVGYDWLYSMLTVEQRHKARMAIEEKGLKPYLEAKSRHWWEKGGNNWNQVCHAGMVSGALALLEDDSERAVQVVSRALAGLPHAMKVYEPDGTYPEGPGYWNYGTTFNVLLIEMLESVCRTDFGLSQSPGFLKSGEFMLQIMGPTRRTYNFSDCGTGTGFSPGMAWFAARAGRPEWLSYEWELLAEQVQRTKASQGRNQGERYFPLVLTWAKPPFKNDFPRELNWLGKGQNSIAVLRSSWTNPNATYLAIKAGTPGASHGHMDVGSFVLDALGERWSLDLGAEDYNKLEQRGIGLWNNKPGSDRWRIFRYHTRAHSTLMVNDAEQVVSSKAPISAFSARPSNAYTEVDLTETYAGQLKRANRRFSLAADQSVTIEDMLTGGTEPAQVRWGMTTTAELKADGSNAAWLVKNGKRLRMEVKSPESVSVRSWPANPPPNDFDTPNPGTSVVGFVVPLKAGQEMVIKVVLTPAQAR